MVQSAHQNVGSAQPPLERLTQQKTRVFCLVKWKTQIGTGFFCIHHSMASHYGMDCSSPTTGRPTGDFDLFWAMRNLETSCPMAIHARQVSEMIVCDSMQHAGAMFRVEKCFSTKSAHLQLIWRKSSPRNVRLWRIKNLTTFHTENWGSLRWGCFQLGFDGITWTKQNWLLLFKGSGCKIQYAMGQNLDTCSRGVILFPPHQGHRRCDSVTMQGAGYKLWISGAHQSAAAWHWKGYDRGPFPSWVMVLVEDLNQKSCVFFPRKYVY